MVVPSASLTLIGKPDCHLCDEARDAVTSVLAELPAAASVDLEELSILENAELSERYWDEIPVLMINGSVHTIWRIDRDRLKQALLEATA
jgi:glutaredoxin